MTTTSTPVTIAGITLGTPNSYVAEIDTVNEAALVARLRKLPDVDFADGMQALANFLHTLDKGLVVDRYLTLLVSHRWSNQRWDEGQDGADAASI